MSGHSNALPTMLYAAVLMMSCLLSAAMWGYACFRPGLVADEVTPAMRRAGVIVPLLTAGVFAVSIGVAYVADSAEGQWAWLLAAVAGPLGHRLSRA